MIVAADAPDRERGGSAIAVAAGDDSIVAGDDSIAAGDDTIVVGDEP